MKNISPLFSFILLLVISCFTCSFAAKKTMVVCPNAKSFQSITFDEILKGDHPGVWTLVQKNQSYNTPLYWEFSLMVEANDKTSALKKAKLALVHLRKKRGPEKADTVWVCDYVSKFSMMGTAVSVR